MDGFGHDVFALLGTGPELDAPGCILDILTHTDHIVEKMLRVEIGILTEWDIDRLHTDNAVEGEIEEHKVARLRTKQEPAVAELLQQVWTEDELCGTPCRERLIHDAQRLLVGNVVV